MIDGGKLFAPFRRLLAETFRDIFGEDYEPYKSPEFDKERMKEYFIQKASDENILLSTNESEALH